MVTKTDLGIGVGVAVVLAMVPLAGGASFTLSDAALMSLDWNYQNYYKGQVKARILERRDIPGPGVEFDILFPSASGLDLYFYALSSSRGGWGALLWNDVSMYTSYELLITLKAVNGGRTIQEGDRLVVGAQIETKGTPGAYRTFLLDFDENSEYPESILAYTEVKGAQLLNVGFITTLFPSTNNHWNPEGTIITLLVEPAPGATPISPWPGLMTLEQFARFAAAWMRTECIWPGWCGGGDLNEDGFVNGEDLLLLAEYWLAETPPNWRL